MISRESNSIGMASTELLDDILDALRRGESIDIDELVDQHPEEADDIRQLAAVVALVQDAATQLDPGGDLDTRMRLGRRPPVVGDFRIVREIARGGMGVVYEAQQISLDRRVALKVLLPGVTYSANTLERFLREARTAGALHHSNIVPVYAVGEHDSISYYAMQYIEGRSLDAVITAWRAEGAVADARHARRVARWARDVARALTYAHGHGVIHRDIKPSNILIDDDEQIRVTDFGLARRDVSATLTLSGDLVGTVRYMSPEQARGGGVVDERSDVYSLGATLYELLTLHPVFEGEDRHAVLTQVLMESPRSIARVAPAVPRALATIVHTALAKSPEHRYAGASVLAEDLQRFLDDRPLLVQPPGPWRRARQFVTRHRLPVAIATAVILVLAALVGVLGVQSLHLAEQRDRIASEAASAARASEFLRSILAFGNPKRAGADVTMGEVLDDAAARVEAELGDDPRVEMEVRSTIGNAYWEMSRFADAQHQLSRALELQRAQSGDADPPTVVAAAQYASLLGYLARYEDAVELLRGIEPRLGPHHVERPVLLTELARAMAHLGRCDEALSLADRAIKLNRDQGGLSCGGVVRNLLGKVAILGLAGRDEEALGVMREVVETESANRGPRAPEVAEALGTLSQMLLFLPTESNLVDAEASARRGVEIMSEQRGPNDSNTLWLKRQLANVLTLMERFDEAEALYREALERNRAVLGAQHYEVAMTLQMYGRMLARAGRPVHAAAHLEEGWNIRRSILGEDHPETLAMAADLEDVREGVGTDPGD